MERIRADRYNGQTDRYNGQINQYNGLPEQHDRQAADAAYQAAQQYEQRVTAAGAIPPNEILNVIKAYTAAQTLGSADAAVVVVGLYNDLLHKDVYSAYAGAMDASTLQSIRGFMRQACEAAFSAGKYDLQVVLHYAELTAETDKRRACNIVDTAIRAGAPAGKYAAVMLTANGTLPDRYGTEQLKQMAAEIKSAYSPVQNVELSRQISLYSHSQKQAELMYIQAEKYREQVSVNGEIPARQWETVFRKYEGAYAAGSVDAAAKILDLGCDYLDHLNPANTGRWGSVIRLMKECGEKCYTRGRYDVVTDYAGLYAYGMGDFIPKDTGKAWALIDEAIAHHAVEGKLTALVFVCNGSLPDRKGISWLRQMLQDVETAYPDDDFSEYRTNLAKLEQQQQYDRQGRVGQGYPTPGTVNGYPGNPYTSAGSGYPGNPYSTDPNSNADRLDKLRKELDRYSPIPVAVMVLLAFFGLHRIVAGKYVSFIIFFLTCGGCGIWIIIDIITILTGSWTDMNGRMIAAGRGRIKREIAALERNAG